MQRLIRSIVLVGLVVHGGAGTVSARPVAEADGGGLGVFLDWLHKLSGPRFVGGGVSGFVTLPGDAGIRLRLSGAYRTSIGETGEVTPDDANITMLSVQPAVEFPVQRIPIDFGVGVALHRFGGDADGFWHYSVPVYVQFRPRNTRRIAPLLGIGVHIFPRFEPSDFAPLAVTVSRQDSEAVLQVYAGVSIRL
jgi:hypothetical protein